MINQQQLYGEVVRPQLDYLADAEPKLGAQAAGQLIMATIATESNGGEYLCQVRGPALGIIQMEPATLRDIIEWLDTAKNARIRHRVFAELSPTKTDFEKLLVTNLEFAITMCRIFYWRVREALPEDGDWPGMARYWKKYYNTELGKGTPQNFMEAVQHCRLESILW